MKKSKMATIIMFGGLLIILLVVLFFTTGMSVFRAVDDDKLALIEINGIITNSQETIRLIRKYDEDESIKAIILRIDSPGGVVGPSQEIYMELNKINKNIITSMGSVAASGGYYIACASDRIFANPGTITGSIGVVMSFPKLQELSKKIGFDREVVKSGKYKDAGSSLREMTPEERQLFQSMVDDVHEQFVEAVYEGRKNAKLTKEQIEELADGRAFSGRQALQLKLIDDIGTLYDAVDYTAKISGIEGKPKVIKKRERESIIDRFIGIKFGGKINNIIDNQVSLRYELFF